MKRLITILTIFALAQATLPAQEVRRVAGGHKAL
jgi:hypothetical protein